MMNNVKPNVTTDEKESALVISDVKKKNWIGRLKTNPCVNPIIAIAGTLPAMILILVFMMVPGVLNLVMSFTDYNGILTETNFVWFQNYVDFFKVIGDEVLPAFGNTIKYAAIVILPLQVLALGSALLVNSKVRFTSFFRAVYFMPSVLGGVVIASVWKIIYYPAKGPLAQYLGMSDSAFLGDEKWALVYVAIMALWASYGYSMTIYLAGLQGIPTRYYEAATIDGAGGWARFRYITMPLLRPTVVICLWIAISGTLGMSDYILLTTNGLHNTETIGFYIFRSVVYGQINQGLSAAVAMYNFLFVSIIMLAFWYFVKRRSNLE